MVPGTQRERAAVRTLYRRLADHDTTGSAAQLAYYLLLAAFPFLLMLVTLTAFLPLRSSVDGLLAHATGLMPPQALGLLTDHLHDLLNNPRPRLLTLGLLGAIWTASRGADAVRKGLNLAYDVKESRPAWRTTLTAIAITLVGALLVLAAFAGFALGGKAGEWLAQRLHVEPQWHFAWSYLRWPATALLSMLVAALTYYFLPDVEQRFRFITPGSVLGSIFWLLADFGFTQYAEHFGNYNAAYGSIGGVALLMVWLYISGLIFLVGGEVNALLEEASPEGKRRGARSPGERPPPFFERPSAGQGKAPDSTLH